MQNAAGRAQSRRLILSNMAAEVTQNHTKCGMSYYHERPLTNQKSKILTIYCKEQVPNGCENCVQQLTIVNNSVETLCQIDKVDRDCSRSLGIVCGHNRLLAVVSGKKILTSCMHFFFRFRFFVNSTTFKCAKLDNGGIFWQFFGDFSSFTAKIASD